MASGGLYLLLLTLVLAQVSSEDPQDNGAPSLAFVFDVTGSMYDDLRQVIEGANRILERTLTRRTKAISSYVLVPFHDPGKRERFPGNLLDHRWSTTSPNEFSGWAC